MLGCGFRWSGLTAFFSFNMSFLLTKVEDLSTISKLQSLTSVRRKDCTSRVPNKILHYFFLSNHKSNLYFTRHISFICVFFIFNAGGSVCGCMCVYTHKHTHAAQIGYSVVSPGVGMRHLEGPKNPDKLNLGVDMFVYVYKKYVYARRRDKTLD